MRRLRWWLFLVRYRVARWRGKLWATGCLRPEFIFAYRQRDRALDAARFEQLFLEYTRGPQS